MSLDSDTRTRIETLVQDHSVLLFMKGTRQAPQCGFSAQVIQILDRLLPEYGTLNVLEEPEIREGIKEFSQWPTIPQLYIGGDFVGGCDIVVEMDASGELHEALGVPAPAPVEPPTLHVSGDAAELIRQSMQGSQFQEVHVRIDASFNHQLGYGPREPGQVASEAAGITFLFDRDSAARAAGLGLDVEEGDGGRGLSVDNPNQPRVHQMAPRELAALLEAGESLTLIDVRTPEEHATAHIDAAQRLDEADLQRLGDLPRDTRLIFHCHHGGRSQAAAERFAAAGFRNVHNLAGGIDAWSTDVDPSVPRY